MTLPIHIAKALKDCMSSPKDCRDNLRGILAAPTTDGARYTATDGHVLLTVEEAGSVPTEERFFDAGEVAKVIESKGYYKPEGVTCHGFPDWERVLGDSPKAVKEIGFNTKYLSMMPKISRALGIKSSHPIWEASLGGTSGPSVWRPAEMAINPVLRDVRFVIMPCHLSTT